MAKLTLAPENNRFHGVGTKGARRETGERLEDAGNGFQRLYVAGKFIALVPKES